MGKTLTKNGFQRGPRFGFSVEDRFWEKVNKSEVGCWEWIGVKSKKFGYGVFYVEPTRPTVNAHRFSWELHHGEIPDSMNVCHKCDNPKCVRPDHLFLGTYLDNNRDMVSKERHGRMKFTHEQVERIRALYERHKDVLGHRRIADWFGVSKATISHMLSGRNWKLTSGPVAGGRVGRKRTAVTDSQIQDIKKRRVSGEKLRVLSAEFGVNMSYISQLAKKP